MNIRKHPEPLQMEAIKPGWIHHMTAHKHGFDENEMRTAFDAAGLGEQTFADGGSFEIWGQDVLYVIAAARKSQ